ncbi:hypothetical protein N7533_010835 [Penicillium manginii]|jgi:hypothetical protein|uniref:uncharacterized protein n=1 Tax=Penicillium manginii TaxID=203109 RepID=UPI0025482499|nr:uncharacterized protein N7533_010835 [Penicillium manginii]KAJ5741426.1 hypothetical protein N7533_010835 [Penicillium manginii]
MSSPLSYDVRHDGLISSFGRFLTEPGRVERVDVSQLRSLFLPNLTPEGEELLRNAPNFVRSQLKHYGVQFKKRALVGNGTALMKAALKVGKFPNTSRSFKNRCIQNGLAIKLPKNSHPTPNG